MKFLKKQEKAEVIEHKEQRVAVLIDVQNMYHSAKNLYNSRVNFKNVLEAAKSSRKLIRAIAYGIETESGDEKKFFIALKNMGIDVKMKELQIFPGGMKKGDWDVGIAVDAVKFSQYVDVIVLVTGDGDFIPLIEYLQNATPVRVEIIAFDKSCSGKIKQIADSFIDLGKNTKKYLLK